MIGAARLKACPDTKLLGAKGNADGEATIQDQRRLTSNLQSSICNL
jgi:hypothetical protein